MPRNRLELGLTEWKANLTAEPAALATAARPYVSSAADDAANELRAAYPAGPTGNLKAGVRVDRDPNTDAAITAAQVVSGAPHAHLYEGGTRHTTPKPTFYPITNKYGRDLERELHAVVETAGYNVSGNLD